MSNIHGFHNLSSTGPPASGPRGPGAGYGGPSSSGYVGRNFAPAPGYASDRSPEGGLSMSIAPPRDDGLPLTWFERFFPRASWYTLTTVLTVIQLIIFLVELIVGGAKFDGAFVSGNPMGGPSASTLEYMGGKYGPDIRNRNEVWRLITPIFLHAGILHILSNLFFQLRFGFTLEARWGIWRFAVVYVITGIGASLWSCVLLYNSVSVGASGALFGLLGADLIYLIYNWEQIPHNKNEAVTIVIVVVINLLIGIGGDNGVDNYAHIGGFITGMFFALCILPTLAKREKEFAIRCASWLIFIGHMILFICLLWAGTPKGA